MKEFFRNAFAKVYYNDELDALYLKYLERVPDHEQFILINQALLRAFCQLNTRKLVMDIRRMGVIVPESQRYIATIILPAMSRHIQDRTLLHAQLLEGCNIFSKITADNIKKKSLQSEDEVEFRQFMDEVTMEAYLKNISE